MSPYYIEAQSRASRQGRNGPRPLDFSGYQVAVYHRGKKVASALHQYKAQSEAFGLETPRAKFERSDFSMSEDKKNFRVKVDTSDWPGPRHVCLDLVFSPAALAPESGDSADSPHAWIIVAPDCEVSGRIEISEYGYSRFSLDFTGRGYHDHNLGSDPIQDSNLMWFWGRFHSGPATYMYYVVIDRLAPRIPFTWLGVFDDGALASTTNATLELATPRIGPGLAMHYPTLTINGQVGQKTLALRVAQESMGELSPFYYRYRSYGYGLAGTNTQPVQGISEFFYSPGLKSSFHRAMLKMPFFAPVS